MRSKLNLIILLTIYTCQNISTIGIITISSIFSTRKRKGSNKKMNFQLPTSQSQLLNLQPKITIDEKFIGSQSQKLDEKLNKSVRVAFTEDKAYWVHDNMFYSAEIIDGEVDQESTNVIDMFSASEEDLKKYLLIIDGLKG